MNKNTRLIVIVFSIWALTAAAFGQANQRGPYDPGAVRKTDQAARVDTINASFTGDIGVAGRVFGSLGSAAAPTYTFTGDTDTGVYLPAANTLGLAGGGVVGLQTSAGNVAIGTVPSVSYKLDLKSTNQPISARVTNVSSELTSNAAQYRKALALDTINQGIATGVTNTGYVMGLEINSQMDAAAFKGTLKDNYGAFINAGIYEGTGTITNCYALRLTNFNLEGTITNNWAIYQDTAAARNYLAGRTLFGTTADDGVSAVQVSGGGLRLVGSTAPATPAEGAMYFDSADKHFYGWNGTAWVQLDN